MLTGCSLKGKVFTEWEVLWSIIRNQETEVDCCSQSILGKMEMYVMLETKDGAQEGDSDLVSSP